jgi:hypothetical protein
MACAARRAVYQRLRGFGNVRVIFLVRRKTDVGHRTYLFLTIMRATAATTIPSPRGATSQESGTEILGSGDR